MKEPKLGCGTVSFVYLPTSVETIYLKSIDLILSR